MDISVIICTHNRYESLRRTLDTCCNLVIPGSVKWELLVIDNNSTDATKQVCEEFSGKLPLRYIFEPRQGKSYALNAGVQVAAGALLLFTDDDVDVDRNWIGALYDAAHRHPQAYFFGGRIIPRWETPPPKWIAEHAHSLLAPVMVHYDRGENEEELREYGPPGANMTIRKSAFDSGRSFRTDLGLTGQKRIGGEDAYLIRTLLDEGLNGIYVPTAIVHHRNPANRMTERYICGWFKSYGRSKVLRDELGKEHCWFGVPRYLWKRLLINVVKYPLARWTCPSRIWLSAEIKAATVIGVVCETIQIGKNRGTGNEPSTLLR